ncbi:hypothetical protein EJB05_16710, partial [Eragrostis curvula]
MAEMKALYLRRRGVVTDPCRDRHRLRRWQPGRRLGREDGLQVLGCIANYNTYHNVLEVTKHSFDACITTNPISYDTSGSTTVLLTMPGKRYFICGAPGHCLAGMKMEIEVDDRPAPTTPTSPPPLQPPPPAGYARRQPAPAPTTVPLTPAPTPSAPAPRSMSPAPAPAAAPPSRRVGHKKKHKKRYCSPEPPPARAPTTVQSVEADFPVAAFAPMSSPPPPSTSGGPAVLRAMRGEVAVALAALGGFMLVAP